MLSNSKGSSDLKWYWEMVDVTRSGAAGDVSKLFKNENIKEPGVLSENAPPAAETVLAREVIQNSWDAARELAECCVEHDEELPEFFLEFEFREHRDRAKKRLVADLGLEELRARLDTVGEGATTDEGSAAALLGLSSGHALDGLGDNGNPLRLLEIREHGTTGMYGPFTGTSSKLYLALVSIGFTIKALGSGGSYGYGKAGLIRGSSTRTVIAYTCFRERPDDPGVTRRLLGMTYWGRHEVNGSSFTGFSRFGQAVGEGVPVPFENEEADTVAASLGLQVRSPEEDLDLGTTFLLVEPTISAQPLCEAIERNWWPALLTSCFDVDIFTADGDHIIPRPRTNRALLSFTRGFELATVPQDSDVAHEWSRRFRRLTPDSGRTYEIGALGLVADLRSDGWSYPNAGGAEETRHRSLVALVRGPRMVVEYLDCGSAMPLVRGTFLAADEIDDQLRQTEPKGHDSWQTKTDLDGVHPDAVEIARSVKARIRQQVAAFRRSLRPPTTEQRDIRLPVLEDLFRRVLDGTGTAPPGPRPVAQPVVIRIDREELRECGNQIQLAGTVSMALGPGIDVDELPIEARLRYVFLEDGTAGADCVLEVSLPTGFALADGRTDAFRGLLTREEVSFGFVTAPYAPDWSGRLAITADPVPSGSPG